MQFNGLLLGESSMDFIDSLVSGVVLCKLINSMVPGAIKTIKEDDSSHVISLFRKILIYLKRKTYVDNLHQFLNACKQMDLAPSDELFEPFDLIDKKDVIKVVYSLYSMYETLYHDRKKRNIAEHISRK